MNKLDSKIDRDQQILSRLGKIEHKVDSLEQTTAFALRANEAAHFESVKVIFRNSQRKAQVYLAANGQRSVGELASHLSMKQPNVSSALSDLREEGLLEIIDTVGGSNIWAKTALDRTLRISKFLTTEYNLTVDGKPTGKSKKTK